MGESWEIFTRRVIRRKSADVYNISVLYSKVGISVWGEKMGFSVEITVEWPILGYTFGHSNRDLVST